MGKVSNKASMTHIANPVLPTKTNPLISKTRKRPPKANDMRMDAIERLAPSFWVNLGEYDTLRAGFEKGVLKTRVVTTNMTNPKYQSLYSVQTPLRLE